jgi:hypothetical protein
MHLLLQVLPDHERHAEPAHLLLLLLLLLLSVM